MKEVKMNRINSSSLFHFTKEFDILKKIIVNGKYNVNEFSPVTSIPCGLLYTNILSSSYIIVTSVSYFFCFNNTGFRHILISISI